MSEGKRWSLEDAGGEFHIHDSKNPGDIPITIDGKSDAKAVVDLLNTQQERIERLEAANETALSNNVRLLAERRKYIEALKQINTISLELTVQSRSSAAFPGARIANVCAVALGWLTEDEVYQKKDEGQND